MAIVSQLLETHDFARLNADQRKLLDQAISAELLKERALMTRLRGRTPDLFEKDAATLTTDERKLLEQTVSAELAEDQALLTRLRRRAPELLDMALKRK